MQSDNSESGVYNATKMFQKWIPGYSDTILVSFLAFLIGVLWLYIRRPRHKLPPGPWGLPIVGYLPFLSDKPYVDLQNLRKKFGPVYRLKLGSQDTIVLCDYSSIKDAFSQDAFNGRPTDSNFESSKESQELGVINGEAWRDQRRFSMRMLRDLGLGKASMEEMLKEEINELLGRFEKDVGKPIESSNYLAPSMSNNMSMLMFGKRRKFDDPKRVVLDGVVRDVGRLLPQAAWHAFFPWIRVIANYLGLGNREQVAKVVKCIRDYISEEVVEHQKTIDPHNARDYVDGYLLEIEKRKNDPKSSYKVPVLGDQAMGFFLAGSETVRISMDWLLLICATNPDIQRKVQAEIDEVVGRERLPSRNDQKQMPYTDAVTLEMQRWRTIVPINILRYTLENATVQSYFIPKNKYVMANFWAVHYDTELWGEDVDIYRPERFLSEDGKKVVKPEYLLPFSMGKRSCPGESLAIVEVFLYFTSVLQKFTVKLPEGTVADFDGVLGIGLQPKPYKLIFELRK